MSEAKLELLAAPKSILRSEAFILAALPILGSIIAYLFEIGYLRYFEVPAEYVEIGFNRVFGATVFFSLPIIALAYFIYWAALLSRQSHPFFRVISRGMLAALLPSFLWFLDPMPEMAKWVAPGIILLTVLLYLVPPIFQRSDKSDYWDRVARSLEEEAPKVSGTRERSSSGPAIEFASIVFVLMMAALLCTSMGHYSARSDKLRLVLKEAPSYIFVRKYGDNYIFKEYDHKSKKLLPGIVVHKVPSPGGLALVGLEIGELVESDARGRVNKQR